MALFMLQFMVSSPQSHDSPPPISTKTIPQAPLAAWELLDLSGHSVWVILLKFHVGRRRRMDTKQKNPDL